MDESKRSFDKWEIEDKLSLTPMQESLLDNYLNNPEKDFSFSQLSLNISGKIDAALFEKAWNFVVKTNEMLRAFFEAGEMKKPRQLVLKKHDPEIRHFDFSASENNRQRDSGHFALGDRQETCDLNQVPFKVTLNRLTTDTYEMIICHHPMLFDNRSAAIILKEFFTAYSRLLSGEELTEIPKTKFKEYIKWIKNRDEVRHKRYWKNYLADIKKGTGISLKRGRGEELRTFGHFYKELGKDTCRKLKDFIRENKKKASRDSAGEAHPFYGWEEIYQTYSALPPGKSITLPALLYTAYGILLQKYNNCSDVIFGTAVSGRTPKIKGIENIVGLFINAVPLRILSEANEKSVDLIEKVNKTLQKRGDYETSSLTDIKKYSRFNPAAELFDSLLVIENDPIDIKRIQGEGPLIINSYSKYEMPGFDLTMVFTLSENIAVQIIFNDLCFEKDEIERFVSHYINILENITLKPSQKLNKIEMISEVERRQLLYDFNYRKSDFPADRTIPQLFSNQVDRTPDSTAVIYESEEVSYKELDDKSNLMAYSLSAQGVQQDDMVGIMIDRSLELIIGILGILKTGSAYVPLNGKAPLIRNRFIMDECNVKILLTGSDIREQTSIEEEVEYFEIRSNQLDDISMIAGFPEEKTAAAAARMTAQGDMFSRAFESSAYLPITSSTALPENLPAFRSSSSPQDAAYVIFTSGSTGTPKGIAVTHANLSPLLFWGYETLNIGPGDRTLQNLSVYFDWSVWEIFITLTTGTTLCITSNDVLRNPATCIDFITTYDITAFHVTPTQYRYIAARNKRLATLKYLFLGAEKLTNELLERSLASVNEECRVFNMYGPTEATIISAVLEVNRAECENYKKLSGVPIGKPVANLRLLVLDKNLHLCPVNVAGELYIAGDGVSSGYLNQEGLTEESFIVNPYEKQVVGRRPPLMYKTGDLVRWLSDGTIEFLGRIDYQIKIRGFRIEPGEIENQLLKHEDIREVVVTDVVTGAGDKYLCAYVVTRNAELHESLSAVKNENKHPLVSHLRGFLSRTLPDYMIPSRFVLLKTMPLNPSGKVDRKALPTPG